MFQFLKKWFMIWFSVPKLKKGLSKKKDSQQIRKSSRKLENTLKPSSNKYILAMPIMELLSSCITSLQTVFILLVN